MGSFFSSIIGVLGGPFGVGGAFLLNAVGIKVSGGLLGNALGIGPKSPKPQQAEAQIKNSVAPRTYGYGRRRVYGVPAFWGSATNGASVDVLAFLDGQSHAMVQAYLNDEPVTISGGNVQSPDGEAYAGNIVQAGFRLGVATETAHAAVVSALPGVWTSAHRGDGVTTGYLIKQPVKEKRFIERYPQGDNVVLSGVFDMQLCYDPRTDATAWTDNPILHLLHYLTVREGYDYATRILPQIALWEAAADICDETISGEKRYRAWVLYDSRAKPHEVKGSILETCDGWMAENEAGEVLVYAGAYTTPTVTIGPEHILEYEHQGYVESEDYYNEIRVKYISADHDYNEVEAQPWRDEADISARGSVNSTETAPQVPSHKQARRLAKITQARSNAQDRGTVTTNYGGRIIEGQRFINLEIIEAGTVIFDGVAEIVTITRNLETSGFTFEWVKADPNAWAWNPATEDGYGAPTGTFPTIAAPDAPDITAVTYSFDATAQTAALTIEGAGPDRADLTWYARTRRVGDTAWVEREYPDIAAGASVELLVDVAPINTPIEVQISYTTGSGAFSGWSDTETVTADTTATVPDAAGAVTLVSWGSSISLTTASIPRATSYRWRIYASDGTTLKRTIDTVTPATTYTITQANADGVARDYKVTVEGRNAAGSGTASAQLTISKPAPTAVTGISATDGDYSTTITFTPNSAASGNIVFYSDITGFDPETQGRTMTIGNTGTYIMDNLVADTYYFIIAPIDGWTTAPAFLNLSSEYDFTINIGGGGSGGSGGGWEGSGDQWTVPDI